jgi:hypothetical protein
LVTRKRGKTNINHPNTKKMKNEILAAATWWGKQIVDKVSDQQLTNFVDLLGRELELRIAGHWYEDEPIRGSGYRALLVDDVQTDEILLRVAKTCGISKTLFEETLPRPVVMFIDPQRVCVKKLESRTFEYSIVYLNGVDYNTERARTPSPTPTNKLQMPVQQTVMA